MTPTPKQAPTHDPADHRIGAQNAPLETSATHASDVAETDDGPHKAAAVTMRKCIGTGEKAARDSMLRFVVGPDDVVAPDISARLPGRGAWTLATREALDQAVTKKAFNRAFKRQVQTADGLCDQLETLLARKCLDLLGFAKRAGELILGFDQVREQIRQTRPACVVEASDGAADGRRKVLSLARGLYSAPDRPAGTSVIGCFTAEELGMALGRDRVIHAVVKQGRFSQTWLAEIARLGGFRSITPGGWTKTDDEPNP